MVSRGDWEIEQYLKMPAPTLILPQFCLFLLQNGLSYSPRIGTRSRRSLSRNMHMNRPPHVYSVVDVLVNLLMRWIGSLNAHSSIILYWSACHGKALRMADWCLLNKMNTKPYLLVSWVVFLQASVVVLPECGQWRQVPHRRFQVGHTEILVIQFQGLLLDARSASKYSKDLLKWALTWISNAQIPLGGGSPKVCSLRWRLYRDVGLA